MRNYSSYFLFTGLVLFLLSFYSCLNSISGEGELTFATRNVPKFTAVELDIDASLILTDSLEQSCMISAQQNLMPVIETRLNGDKLIISSDKNIINSKPIIIYLSANRLSGISLNGSGNITGSNEIKAESINISLSGSGNIELPVICDKIKADVSGSGNLFLKGSSNESDFSISGSGKIEAFEHNTGNCEASISGSGEAYVFPSGTLSGSISGSGNVIYKGNPAKIESSVSGSGSIEKSK